MRTTVAILIASIAPAIGTPARVAVPNSRVTPVTAARPFMPKLLQPVPSEAAQVSDPERRQWLAGLALMPLAIASQQAFAEEESNPMINKLLEKSKADKATNDKERKESQLLRARRFSKANDDNPKINTGRVSYAWTRGAGGLNQDKGPSLGIQGVGTGALAQKKRPAMMFEQDSSSTEYATPGLLAFVSCLVLLGVLAVKKIRTPQKSSNNYEPLLC